MGRHVAHRKRRPIRKFLIATAAAVFILSMAAAAVPALPQPVEKPLTPYQKPVAVVAPDGASIAFERPMVTTAPAPVPVDDGRMSFTEYRDRYEGTFQILPGYSTAECMAAFSLYNYNVVHGDPYNAPGAQDVWLGNNWTAYDRVPADQPSQLGDVVLWSGSYGAYLGGGYGHVAIVLEDHGDTLLALSQNPTPIVQLELSKYGVLGYLRPRNLKL